MKIKHIPLVQLVPSPDNVRKTGSLNGIKELADSIAAHGLLQNLQVRKAASGKFEVVAGGRRHAALKLQAKKKALAKDAPIACNVLDDEDAAEISLAENEMRQAMHPADQFEAFKALIDSGHGIEDTAARFGVAPTVVRQRLKLAAVSPKLMARRAITREQPSTWVGTLPIIPEQLEQSGRQHDIAIFAALTLLDPDNHTLAVDGRRREMDRFGDPQAGCVTDGQSHAVFQVVDGCEKAGHLLLAQHNR
jgi:ParB/RepB/Spo0J family partition protein